MARPRAGSVHHQSGAWSRGTQQSVVDPVQLAQKVEQLNRAAVTSCKSVVNTNPV